MSGLRLGCLALVLLLAGCHSSPEPLRLGSNVWPGYEPLYLARSRALFAPETARLVELPNASAVMRALRNGSLDGAALTLDEALTVAQEVPLRVVLVQDISMGGDAIVARPPLSRMADLRGHRIAVEGGALGGFVLSRALALSGMELSDVVPRNLEIDDQLEAYRQGMVDAVVTFEPVRGRLIAAGAREVFSSRQIPGEIVDVLVVRADLAPDQQSLLKPLIEAWFAAIAIIEADPPAAAAAMAGRLGVSADEALRSFQGLHWPDRAENLLLLGGRSATTSVAPAESPTLLAPMGQLCAFLAERHLASCPKASGRLAAMLQPRWLE